MQSIGKTYRAGIITACGLGHRPDRYHLVDHGRRRRAGAVLGRTTGHPDTSRGTYGLSELRGASHGPLLRVA